MEAKIRQALNDPDHQARIGRWLENGRSIRVLVTGKTGVGKSTLVNGIVGAEVAKVGSTLDPETTEVKDFRAVIDGVTVIVFDSPGLQDGTGNEKQYLADLEKKCKEVDLVLYCTAMNETRIRAEDAKAVRTLTQALGESFWKHAIFVLTFANCVELPPRKKQAEFSEFFCDKVQQWEKRLKDLVAQQLEPEVATCAEDIPVVLAGNASTPSLPNCSSWLAKLWFTCLERTATDAQPALLKINWRRLKAVERVKSEDVETKPLHQQPIPIVEGSPYANFGRVVLQNAQPLLRQLLGLQQQSGANLSPLVCQFANKLFGKGLGGEIGGAVGTIFVQLILKYLYSVVNVKNACK